MYKVFFARQGENLAEVREQPFQKTDCVRFLTYVLFKNFSEGDPEKIRNRNQELLPVMLVTKVFHAPELLLVQFAPWLLQVFLHRQARLGARQGTCLKWPERWHDQRA